MSLKLYDYQCQDCGIVEERRIPTAETDTQEHCGQLMKRLPCAPHLSYTRMGNDPDMPTAWNKKGDWIEKRHKDAGQGI